MLKSKIHRAVVTEADLNYVGSITLDEDLMKAADILAGEKVQILNINNGNRFETYALEGKAGSGIVCLNGAAARLVQPGDKIIIIAYCLIEKSETESFKPSIVIIEDGTRNKPLRRQ